MHTPTTEDLALAADKTHRRLAVESARLAEQRFALPIGSSRARVTTLNARWARTAEARDQREREVRAAFRVTSTASEARQ